MARLMVPIFPVMPGSAVSEMAVAVETVYGGHAVAHAPVQLLTLLASLVYWYKVIPFAAVKYSPKIPPPELLRVIVWVEVDSLAVRFAVGLVGDVGDVVDVVDVGV